MSEKIKDDVKLTDEEKATIKSWLTIYSRHRFMVDLASIDLEQKKPDYVLFTAPVIIYRETNAIFAAAIKSASLSFYVWRDKESDRLHIREFSIYFKHIDGGGNGWTLSKYGFVVDSGQIVEIL